MTNHHATKRPLCLLLLVGLVCATTATTHATVQPARTMAQMVQGAADIVHAKVLDQTSFWGNGNKHIYTAIKLQVIAYLKGSGGKTLTIHKLGGQVGKWITKVPGSASYKAGEEIVVFLEPKRHKTFRFVLGMASGKFQVTRADGKLLLHRQTDGLAFHRLPGGTDQPSVSETKHSEPALALSALKQLVQKQPKAMPILKANTLRQRYLLLLKRGTRVTQPLVKSKITPQWGKLLPKKPLPQLKSTKPTK